ncbi:MAG TPA: energy-coupling factor transporter transmembrane protein EcfT, partial [Aigarchaeota archaeon]|nr:energy-coupling factor transporter transmembrane protein EcfT [Aigarchaeota archaeon]
VFIITFLTDYSITGLTINTIYRAFTYSYRIILFLSSFSLFFLTTTPDEIALTMTKMKIPYQYTFAFVSAIRFTPVLAQEIKNIMDAQKARGLELDKGSFIRRVRKLIPILVPLLVNVLRRSYELAEAMEVKCFGVAKNRTYLHELQFRRRDYVFLASVLLLFSVEILSWSLGLRPDSLLLSYLGLTEFSKLS